MADEDQISQSEVEKLLQEAQGGDSAEPTEAAATSSELDQSEIESLVAGSGTPPAAAAPADSGATAVSQDDIELLLNQAQDALDSIDGKPGSLPPGVQAFQFKDFVGAPASDDAATLELMQDVELDLKIELGRTYMQLEDVLRLKKGAVVTLDRLAGDPVDIYVNGRQIARGEVLVLNDNFCIRVAELIVGESAVA